MKNVTLTKDAQHHFKYYDMIAMLSVAVWMIASVVAQKVMNFGGFMISVSVAIFPVSYLLSDILTEVYGYARARRVTWMTIFTLAWMFGVFSWCIAAPPATAVWQGQQAFAETLTYSPRIIAASVIALFVGEMTHAFMLSKMKLWTGGEQLWMRIISSTFIAQGLGLGIFYTIAFAGVLSFDAITVAILSLWFLKTVYEAVMTPLTYFVINRLKRVEGVDFFDTHTNYTPFSLSVRNEKSSSLYHAANNQNSPLTDTSRGEKKHG